VRRWATCYQTAQGFAQNMFRSTDARHERVNTVRARHGDRRNATDGPFRRTCTAGNLTLVTDGFTLVRISLVPHSSTLVRLFFRKTAARLKG
jgi:hypothetical protein